MVRRWLAKRLWRLADKLYGPHMRVYVYATPEQASSTETTEHLTTRLKEWDRKSVDRWFYCPDRYQYVVEADNDILENFDTVTPRVSIVHVDGEGTYSVSFDGPLESV